MSIRDFITEDIISLYSEEGIDLSMFAFSIIVVLMLSLVILITYKRSYQTTVYNRSLAIGLPIVSMITTVIVISVSSNLGLALGMVGALSIVRFRTALKNPFDTVFMFWAVGLGVTVGAGMIVPAVISTVLIAIAILLLIYLEVFVSSYFLIIRAEANVDEEAILDQVQLIYSKYTLRNKTVKDSGVDLTLEVRSKEDKSLMINKIKEIESVKSVILLSHNGDYISE